LWKQFPLIILLFVESSKEQHLFEIEIFSKIVDAFTVTFDRFIVSSLNTIRSVPIDAIVY